jgi:protein-S-isoprenylcysteine O-methyltransferase Ste14
MVAYRANIVPMTYGTPQGAPTRGTRRPTAESLSTLGAYSIVRHLPHVASTLVALGCGLLSGTWYLPSIVALLSFIDHERPASVRPPTAWW